MKKKLLYFACILFTFTSVYSQEADDFDFFERPLETFTNELYLPTLGWITASRTTLYYNSNDQVVSQIMEVLNFETMNLETTGRATITYDSSGNPVEDLQEEYDSETDTWVNSYRSQLSFSGINILNSLIQRWEEDSWINDYRSSFSYSGGNQSQEIEEMWNEDTSSWTFSERVDYSYNSDELSNSVYYLWNTSMEDWEFDWRETVTRGGSTRTTLTEDYMSGEWMNEMLSTATIDTDGFVVESIDQNWEDSNEEWINESKNIRTKNSNGWIDTILIQTWYDITQEWVDSARIIFTYRDSSLAIETNSLDERLHLYPNPATNILNISNDSQQEYDLRIYSLTGSEVQRENLSRKNKSVDISNLSKGVYLFEFRNNNRKYVKKIVKL